MPTNKEISQDFFLETKQQSVVKAEIVAKYFVSWARVMIPSARQNGNRIAYFDLYAGRGHYEDGGKSTPLKVLEAITSDADFRSMVVTHFNDVDSSNVETLEKAIKALPNIESLKYKPTVFNDEVGEKVTQVFEATRLVPSFFFIDPCGYKGLSLRLLTSVIKDWGCDAVFFFNYNRINMGLTNPAMVGHMDDLFGKERAEVLRLQLPSLKPSQREVEILKALIAALRERGGAYVVPFCFKKEDGSKTSHYLIFVCKDYKGFDIMRGIMASYSTSQNDGVPSFVFNPIEKSKPVLFSATKGIADLENELLREFSGQTLQMKDIDRRHSRKALYLSRNYKEALRRLEARALITVNPPASKRRVMNNEVTFADDVMVSFPLKG